jgi:hypothetical protein
VSLIWQEPDLFFLVRWVALIGPISALYAEIPKIPESLEDLEITSTFSEGVSPSVSTFYANEYRDFADYLSIQNGFYLFRQGASGRYSPLFRRGLGPEHIEFILEGFSLQSFSGFLFNPENLPSAWNSQLQILTVSQTKNNSNTVQIQSQASHGGTANFSLNHHHGSEASLSWSDEYWSLLWSSRYFPNRYPYWDRNRTPYNTEDDSWKRLENARHQSQWFALKRNFGSKIQLSTLHFIENGGIQGAEGNPTESAFFQNQHHWIGFTYKNNFLEWTVPLNWNKNFSQWGPEDRLYYNISDTLRWTSRALMTGSDLSLHHDGKYHDGSSHFSYQFDQFEPTLTPPTFPFRWKGKKHKLGFNQKQNLHFSSWNSHASVAIETALLSRESPEQTKIHSMHQVNWRANTSFTYLGENWSGELRGGRNFLNPSFIQWFGGHKGLLPNPTLKSEQIYLIEAELKIQKKSWTFKNLIYQMHRFDWILPVYSVQLTKYVNAAQSDHIGWESESIWQKNRRSFHMRHTWARAKQIDPEPLYDGLKVPNHPDFSASFEYREKWTPFQYWLRIQNQSPLFRDRANTKKTGVRHYLSLGIISQFYPYQFSLSAYSGLKKYRDQAYHSFPSAQNEIQCQIHYFF